MRRRVAKRDAVRMDDDRVVSSIGTVEDDSVAIDAADRDSALRLRDDDAARVAAPIEANDVSGAGSAHCFLDRRDILRHANDVRARVRHHRASERRRNGNRQGYGHGQRLQSDRGTKVKQVDSRGSRILKARVALGGKVGARVTLLSTEEPHLLAKIGEAGEVRSLNDDGTVTVYWDRGDESSIDVLNSHVEVHP